MATAVETALQEIEAQLAELEPIYEGLNDFNRLNLEPAAKSVIQESIRAYSNRINALNKAAEVLGALLDTNYPEIPVVEVEPDVMADLTANVDTIGKAFAKFTAAQAATLGLTPQPPQPK